MCYMDMDIHIHAVFLTQVNSHTLEMDKYLLVTTNPSLLPCFLSTLYVCLVFRWRLSTLPTVPTIPGLWQCSQTTRKCACVHMYMNNYMYMYMNNYMWRCSEDTCKAFLNPDCSVE